MRTLTTGQRAAVPGVGLAAAPDLRVELLDWAPHYGLVTGGTQVPVGRSSACIAPDGSLVQAYNDEAGHVWARRVTAPASAGSYGAWGLGYAAANTGICVYVYGGTTVRLLWQDSGTTRIMYSDSGDSGQTWSGAAALFDPGRSIAGPGADGGGAPPTTPVFVLDSPSAGVWRVQVWSYGGSWSGADWTNADQYGGAGLSACALSGGGGYLLAVAVTATATSGTSLQTCTYTGAGFSGLVAAIPADVGAGQGLYDPHLAVYDGLYHLSVGVQDSGAVTGLSERKVALLHSADGVHWSDPLEDANSYVNGAAALKHSSGYVLSACDATALAPLYTGSATQYKDCTADVAGLSVEQKDGEPAKITVRLLNDANQYTGLAALRPNARLRLSLGYVGSGTVYTHVGYVGSWESLRAAGVAEVEIVATDQLGWLDRQSRTTLLYTNQTLGWLLSEVLARAGCLTVSLPATAQFSQAVPSFVVNAGSTWRSALLRLTRLYGCDAAARAHSDGTDGVAVTEKSGSDASVWTYGDELGDLNLIVSGDRANHVLVYGAPGAVPMNLGEAWDTADVGSVGQERYLHVVEPLITSPAGAALRASLELGIEARRAVDGAATAAVHAGLELWDVVGLTGVGVIRTPVRVRALHHVYDAAKATYDLTLSFEGV